MPLTLSAPQHIFLRGLGTKFRAFVGGFGSGKTAVGCIDLLTFALEHPGLVQGYFGPTYPNIRDVFFPTMAEMGEMLGFRVVVREANKEVHMHRGRAFYGTVICRSMDSPDSIVGFKIARALVDEIDTLPKDKAAKAWNKIVARLRLEVPGVVNGIGVTTTPEGFRFVYERFASPTASYSMVQASTWENQRFLPPDYIPSLIETYPAELIEAYLEGRFVNLTSGTVYRQFDRVRCASAEAVRPGEPLRIGMDFNVRNMAAVAYVLRGEVWHAVAELTGGVDTPAMIRTIQERWAGHHVTVYPDASGANTSSKGASLSDIGLLRQAGFAVRARDTNPRVRDRVLALNTALEKGRLRVSLTGCPAFTKGLEQQAYDQNGEPDKATGHDHINDAGGYPVAYEMPVVKPGMQQRELRL